MAKKTKKKSKKEMWRPVQLSDGVYEVSNTCKVRRADTQQELKPFGKDNRVCLHKKGKRIAQVRVVALVKDAFPSAKL